MSRILMAAAFAFAMGIAQQALAQTRYATLDEVTLRYEDAGDLDAPAIVLLHEMGMTLESWDDIFPVLASDHRVIRYDLRGFGLSEKIVGSVSFDDEVADLDGLLDALEVEGPVTLIGGAVGGATALAYAAQHPDRVAGVIALSPAAGVTAQARPAIMATAARIERTGMRPLVGDMFDIYPAAIRHDPERVARFRAIQLGSDPYSVAATLRMIASTDFTPILTKIKAPVLVVAALQYPQRSVESVKALADAIERGTYAELDTGHFVGIQSPEMLIPLIDSFLAEQSK